MGLENCQIHLDDPNATYFPGQTVTGRVDLNFSSPKKVRGIEIAFKGEATAKWSESETYRVNGKTHTRSISYVGSENYFNIKYFVLGGPNNDSIEIPAGNHVYALQCTLPTVLPSSFEGDLGHVRYTVKVTLVRPWKFDQTIKAAFTVITHLDINLNPQWREPATLTMEKYFCCLFCKSGPLTGILKVPCTGFVSGQTIPMSLEIDNVSNIRVTDIKIKLKKVVSYHSHSPSRKTKQREHTIVEQKIGNTIAPKSSTTFNHSLEIPALPPSNLMNCSVIDLDYVLKITVEVDGMHKNMYGQIPITIGTIPFANMVPMPVPHLSINAPSRLLLGWVPAPLNTPPIDPALMPPPSYEECQFGATTILEEGESKHTQHNANWAPSYPVYHFNLTPTASNMGPGFSGAPSAPPPKQ